MKKNLMSQVAISVSTIFLAFLLVMTLLANPSQRIQKKEIPKEVSREMNRISRLLQPAAKQKAERAMKAFQRQVFSQEGDVDGSRLASQSLLKEFLKLSPNENDVLVALIYYETAQAAEEDIKELAEEIDKMNEAKKKLRRQIQQVTQQITESQSKQNQTQKSQTEKKPVELQRTVSRIQSRPQIRKTSHLGIIFPRTPVVPDLPDTEGVTIGGLKNLLDNL
ncbi:hypothetical protein GH140_04505, partial [bacterium]|nr:hypothetical protein [bacterium]